MKTHMCHFRITIIITRATNFSTMSSRREIEKWKIDIVKKFFDVKVEDENSEEVAGHIIDLVVDAAVDAARQPEDATQARFACQDVRLKQVKSPNRLP